MHLIKPSFQMGMLTLVFLFFGTTGYTLSVNDSVIPQQYRAYSQLDLSQSGVSQETCFNGLDDDGNGFIDDNCPTALEQTTPEMQTPVQPFDQFGNVSSSLGQFQLSPGAVQGLAQQQPLDQFGSVVTQDNTTQQQLQSVQQQLSAIQQQLQSIQQLILQHTQQQQQPAPILTTNQSVPTNQTTQQVGSSTQNLQQCINNAISQGMTNLQIRQQCGLNR